MKTNSWLIIDKNGIKSVRKNKPMLEWDEIAMKVNIEIPNELFMRPTIEATLQVKDIPNNAYNPDIIINTADLIEQQTGAKIVFNVVSSKEECEDKS